jgi:hypothetical protein
LLRHFILMFWIVLSPKIDFISIDYGLSKSKVHVKLLTAIVNPCVMEEFVL